VAYLFLEAESLRRKAVGGWDYVEHVAGASKTLTALEACKKKIHLILS
jgi:hypothetical protein